MNWSKAGLTNRVYCSNTPARVGKRVWVVGWDAWEEWHCTPSRYDTQRLTSIPSLMMMATTLLLLLLLLTMMEH
jgi:hypothetical protein